MLGQCLGGVIQRHSEEGEGLSDGIPTRAKAIRDIASWIELEHNHKRLHSSPGYRTPNEVEKEHRRTRQAA